MRIVNNRRRLTEHVPGFRKWRRGQEGQALVEFAMIVPLLMLVLLAIIQFGRMLETYIVLTDAARTGARQLALEQGNDDPCDPAVVAMMNSASSIGINATNVNNDMTISFASMSTPPATTLPDYCKSTAGTPATAVTPYTYPASNASSSSTAGAEVEGDEATMNLTTKFTVGVFGFNWATVTLKASASDAIE
jgi:hypothetical protein